MKYTCGVEYQTNGKKPSLPDDVSVIALSKLTGYWLPCFSVGEVNWRHIEKFQIVDERYKPKEKDMNDWYEKGELPPVGEVVEFNFVSLDYMDHIYTNWKDGDKLEVIAHKNGLNSSRVAVVWNTRDKYPSCLIAKAMRPIRTEKDKLIDAVEKIIDGCDSVTDRGIAHAIINAGYRKIKPMTEEKFVALVCISFDVDEEFCRELYQGGCRFIEQGE